MVWVNHSGIENEAQRKGKRRVLAGLFLLLAVGALLLETGGADIFPRPRGDAIVRYSYVATFVRSRHDQFMKNTTGRHGVIFVIDPADFGCPPCFDDLQRLSDEAGRLLASHGTRRGAFLVRQSAQGPWSDPASVQRWADGQGFLLPVVMVPERTYTSFNLRKTTVIVVDTSLNAVLVEQIPTARNSHTKILALLEEKCDGSLP